MRSSTDLAPPSHPRIEFHAASRTKGDEPVDAAVVGFQPAKPRVIHTTLGAAVVLEGFSATVTVFLRAEPDVLPAVWTDRRGHHPRRETMQEHDG